MENTDPKNTNMPLGRRNFVLMLFSVLFILIGFILMGGGKSPSADLFSEEMFSFRRITLSVIVVLFGFGAMIYAIMYRPKPNDWISRLTKKH